MKMEQIKAIAKDRGVKPGSMKKAELVRAIQQAEVNNQCFLTGQADSCGQLGCMWREDCD